MKIIGTVLLSLLVLTKGSSEESKLSPELSKLREEYHRRQETALQPVKAWYRQQLQQAEQAAIQRRDLQTAKALKEERESISSSLAGASAFIIVKATYGAGEQTSEVTKQVQALVKNNSLSMAPPWAFDVDPAFGQVKELKIRYSFGGTEKTVTFNQNSKVALP